MLKPTSLFTSICVLAFSVQSATAQDYSLSEISKKPKKTVVSALPSDFLDTQPANPAPAEAERASTAVTNLCILAGFATMFVLGGAITGYSAVRRRPNRKPNRVGLKIGT